METRRLHVYIRFVRTCVVEGVGEREATDFEGSLRGNASKAGLKLNHFLVAAVDIV